MDKILITGGSGYLGSQFIKSYGTRFCISSFSLKLKRLEDIEFNGTQAIVHFAGIVHQGDRVSREEYEKINIEYPKKLAQSAKKSGVKQFVFLSSVSVYGDLTYIDQNSECNPSNKYGISKFQAEQELLKLNDSTLNVSSVIIPMV
jgi:UDP-glucose 4-epimerase